MFCPKCGENLIDGAEFCKKCGAQIKKKEEPAPQQVPVYSRPTAAPAAAVAPNRSKTPICRNSAESITAVYCMQLPMSTNTSALR